jgi:hypothetical protein
MVKRIAIVLSVVFLFGALANASEQWNNNVTYDGNWSDPNWYDSGSASLINHPGGTVDTRISANSAVTLDVNSAQCGPLFVGRGVAGNSGTLVVSDPNAYILVSKASTELMSVGYDGPGFVKQSDGTVKVSTADLSSELRISHTSGITGEYDLSGGLLDVEKLSKGNKAYPGTFNATGGTLVVRTKIFKFGLVSEDASYGFSVGGALLAPGGLGEVGTITNGDSSNKQDFLTTSSSTLEFDIASASSFDKIVSYGPFDLDTCSIKVNLLNGYTPGPDSFFDVFTTIGGDSTYGGTGTPTIITDGWSYEWKDMNNDGKMDTLRLPEPATLSVLALGLGGLLIRRRRS